MFLSRNKKTNVYHCKPKFYYIKMGSKLYRHVFVMHGLFRFSHIYFLSRGWVFDVLEIIRLITLHLFGSMSVCLNNPYVAFVYRRYDFPVYDLVG